jgi:AcrR family transcriptional regulator
MSEKRNYDSKSRRAQAELTKKRILAAAKKLFSTNGVEKTTIDALADLAEVASPTVYALFKSKEGILMELMYTTLFGPQYQSLVEKAKAFDDPRESLKMAASIARTIYDTEKAEMGLIRGASALSPELKKLEKEGERLRYERQEMIARRLHQGNYLLHGISFIQARDILWTLTSRETYRMLVVERGWTSDEYERWLAGMLGKALTEES